MDKLSQHTPVERKILTRREDGKCVTCQKRPTRTPRAIRCEKCAKAVRKRQLKINNKRLRARKKAGTAGHHLVYKGEPTKFALKEKKAMAAAKEQLNLKKKMDAAYPGQYTKGHITDTKKAPLSIWELKRRMAKPAKKLEPKPTLSKKKLEKIIKSGNAKKAVAPKAAKPATKIDKKKYAAQKEAAKKAASGHHMKIEHKRGDGEVKLEATPTKAPKVKTAPSGMMVA